VGAPELGGGRTAKEEAGIERLAWLQGCWSLTTGERDVEEYWMAPKGSSMLGIARTTRNGLLADYDSMDDVDVIASGIETAIAELVDAAATAAEQEVEAESAARQ